MKTLRDSHPIIRKYLLFLKNPESNPEKKLKKEFIFQKLLLAPRRLEFCDEADYFGSLIHPTDWAFVILSVNYVVFLTNYLLVTCFPALLWTRFLGSELRKKWWLFVLHVLIIAVSACQLDRLFFFSLCWLWILKDTGQVARAVHPFLLQIPILRIFSKGDIGNSTNIQVNAGTLSSKLTNKKTRERGLNTRTVFSVWECPLSCNSDWGNTILKTKSVIKRPCKLSYYQPMP